MKKEVKGFILGFLCAAILTAAPVFAESIEKTISVWTDYVRVVVDGEEKPVSNFLSDGRTYLGLRDMAEVLGFEVDWDDATKTAIITTGKAPAVDVTETAITINGQDVPAGAYQALYNNIVAYYQAYGLPIDEQNAKAMTEDELIRQQIVLQEAAKAGIALTEEELQQAEYSLLMMDMQYGAEAVDQMLAQQGIDRTQYLAMQKDFLLEDKFTEHVITNTDAYKALESEAKSYYDSHKEEMKEPTVVVKHVLIPTMDMETGQPLSEEEQKAAETLAQNIYTQAKNGAVFEDLIKANNNDPGMPDEGYTVDKNTNFVQEFKDAALALTKAGDITAPVKTAYGYHIIKAYEISPYRLFDDFFAEYENEKYREIGNSLYEEWKNAAVIEKHDDVIAKIH